MSTKEEQNSVIIERAKSAILARDYEQAARIYKGLLKTEPENMDYLNALGDLYVKNSEDNVALGYYKEIVRLQPQNVVALNSLGAIYRRLKMYDESISVLERAVMCESSNVQTYYNLGFTYKLMENFDDAIQCFTTVVEENPRDVLAFNHMGTIYATERKHAEAVACYLKGLKVDPNHPVLHLNLAKSYDKLGEFIKAQAEYEAALRSKPGWLEAIENYSDLLLRKNKTKTASEIVKKALHLNPKDAAMHTKLGDVYCRQDNYDEAETEYNVALAIKPDYTKAMSGLAGTYETTGRLDEALELAERMEVVAPQDMAVKRQHAHILLSADKIEKAGEKIQELFAADPDDVHTLNLLGQYYICAGDEKKASGCFKKIRALRPDYTSFYREAGKRHSQKGDYKKAEEFYQKFIDQNPEDTEGHKNMAKLYEDQGMLTQALASYKTIENFDSWNVASRNGLERVNNQILEEREKKQERKTEIDADEFFDSDDDISIGERVRVAEEVTLSFEDMDEPEPQKMEVTVHESSLDQYNSGFEKLQDEEITAEEVFAEGRLDDEIEADNKEHYAKSLDDLIGDTDLDDEGTGLEEDNTSAEDFFSNNPFGNNASKSTGPKENFFEPDFEFEEEKPEKKLPKDEVISLDDGWEDDEEFEEEEKPEPKKPPVKKAPARKAEPKVQAEPLPEEEIAFDNEDFDDEHIDKEIMEEPEYVPEPPEEDEIVPEVYTDEEPYEETEEQEIIPEDDGCSDEPSVDMAILAKAADAIQTVADAITENNVMKKANVTADLFEKLRALSTYLPEEKREEFLESKIRLQLDYIISKLSGNRGLLGTAKILRQQLGSEDEASELDSGRTLLLKVLEYSKGLVRELPDASMVSSLNGQIENLIARI
ncbi:tetratricopeptide repeat protein [Treponema sp.]|uniref:tetratricopeptide repeat protein n=1 Tax=Treponema sp. TaxID=166 RepID=UPI00298EAEE5|nr:tetratricopeptide repeat protein [Treponema sp.]